MSFVGIWGHAVAAVLFGALALWQSRHWQADAGGRGLALGFAASALWATSVALLGHDHMLAGMAESGRNFAFLAFMYGIVRAGFDEARLSAVKTVYVAVAGVIGLQLTLAGVLGEFSDNRPVYDALASTLQIIGLTIAAGSLVLVHNLYGQAAPDSRRDIRLPALALACMWGFDLHLYTIAYLTRGPVADLFALRGGVIVLLAPLFALGLRRTSTWKVQLSRAATFQSLSAIGILAYLILMMSATRALELAGGEWVRTGQVALIFAMTIAALLILPSAKLRAWLRVTIAKHFFEHRYDYRAEWLRFTQTMARSGEDAMPIGDRVVKALADIADSPGGLLLLPEGERFRPGGQWAWKSSMEVGGEGDAALARFLEGTHHIIDFDEVRSGRFANRFRDLRAPAWLTQSGALWAGIPLVHNDRLAGLVLLEHPPVRRALDWEDYDLFRTAGSQAASYLTEALSHEALANAQRFDEFNRRFAFILHDVKNLVSQLSLVARNAERHADNPEFRADMIATLQSSVKKLNDLLNRLSRGSPSDAEPPRPTLVEGVIASVATTKRRLHPVRVDAEPGLFALADSARLEQALVHLVQNAIEASPAGAPVHILCRASGGEIAIEVRDEGAGMSADFVRTRLFQPFASTKESGFGLGAFEARSILAAMGGRLEVESREGEGSRFTILLPAAAAPAEPIKEKMRA